jgi:hypothetical protein
MEGNRYGESKAHYEWQDCCVRSYGPAKQGNCISITAAEKLWEREINGAFKGPEVLQRNA